MNISPDTSPNISPKTSPDTSPLCAPTKCHLVVFDVRMIHEIEAHFVCLLTFHVFSDES